MFMNVHHHLKYTFQMNETVLNNCCWFYRAILSCFCRYWHVFNTNMRCSSHNRSKKAVDSESSELSTSEKNKAIEDGQNNNVQPAAYLSGQDSRPEIHTYHFTCPQLVDRLFTPRHLSFCPQSWSSLFLHHYSVCTNTNAAICTISFSPTKKLIIQALQNCSRGTDSRNSSHDSASLFTLMSPRRMTLSRVSVISCPPASPRCSTVCLTCLQPLLWVLC